MKFCHLATCNFVTDEMKFCHLPNAKRVFYSVPKQAVFLIKRAKIGMFLLCSVPNRAKNRGVVCQNE